MEIKILSRKKIFSPEDIGSSITYLANPLLLDLGKSRKRLFFNSRDESNRSLIYSIDITGHTFELDRSTLTLEQRFGPENSYFSHGVSLGSYFETRGTRFISAMGWHVPKNGRWRGEIGLLQLDISGHVESIGRVPWISLSKENPLSLSYPAVLVQQGEIYVWYGSTVSWDAGNGEMLHILKEAKFDRESGKFKTLREIPHLLSLAQAFSRPTIVSIGGRNLMSYSYRGSGTNYRIGFVWLDDLNSASHLGGLISVLPTEEHWENEMVEYSSFFEHSGRLFMLYNGNRYGKTGIGLIELAINC